MKEYTAAATRTLKLDVGVVVVVGSVLPRWTETVSTLLMKSRIQSMSVHEELEMQAVLQVVI